MKKRIFAFLICVGAVSLIFDSPVMSAAAPWTAIRPMSTGIRQMITAVKTTFDGIRTPIRTYGISTLVTYTPTYNGGKGSDGTYTGGTGYTLFKSGSYTMPGSSIASGTIFNYCVIIQDSSCNKKALIYFNNVEEPFAEKSLIVMLPEFFDASAPANTMIELYCYNDGTTPSMKISYASGNADNTSYKIRAFVQAESDVVEVSSFIYKINTNIGYYTVAYAAKTTDINYSTAMQGADASLTTPSNNGLEYPGSLNGNRNYGRFTSASGVGTFINDQVTDDSDANYPIRATVADMYTNMSVSMLSFFNAGGGTGLQDLVILFASYLTI